MTDKLSLNERSRDKLWTDAHIAERMLAAHLDLKGDAASRNIDTIRKTVEWIAAELPAARSILDLGCGPGLYCEQFRERGYEVSGVDLSANSIACARSRAAERGLDIDYAVGDYLRGGIAGSFDAAVCIYCDFGALIPDERPRFFSTVRGALRNGGTLVFDVFGPGLCDRRSEGRTWSYSAGPSFWSPGAHFLLEERVHFPAERAWGRRSVVLEPGSPEKEFITWDYYFGADQLETLLAEQGFELLKIKTGLVAPNDFSSGDVLFALARKIG